MIRKSWVLTSTSVTAVDEKTSVKNHVKIIEWLHAMIQNAVSTLLPSFSLPAANCAMLGRARCELGAVVSAVAVRRESRRLCDVSVVSPSCAMHRTCLLIFSNQMDRHVAELLAATLSADANIRQHGEHSLAELTGSDGVYFAMDC